MQSTAMIGPTMTLVSTGNLYQASLSYGANKAVEKETGMQTTEYLINKIEDNQRKDISVFSLVKKNFLHPFLHSIS